MPAPCGLIIQTAISYQLIQFLLLTNLIHFFNVFILLLYMFRATQCSSSGESIVSIHHLVYRVSQEECARLQEGVPYVKVYRYNPKHLCPKLNGYGHNGQRNVWSSGGSTHCTCQLTTLSMSVLECGFILQQFSSSSL